MTQEEIQERNKQIALMIGVDINFSTEVYRDSKSRLRHIIDKMPKSLLLIFHKDWNWLMEAIQFLHKHFESKESSWTSIERYPLYTDIETVFVLVSDFAKHYNEGKL
jgi:hypothetical protein